MVQTKILFKSTAMTAFELIYWASIIMTLASYLILKVKRVKLFDVPEDLRTTVFIRAMAGCMGNILY